MATTVSADRYNASEILDHNLAAGRGDKIAIMKLVRRDINIFKDPIRDKLIRAYQAALPEQVEAIIRDGIRDGELVDTDPRLLAWEYVTIVEVVLSRYAQRVLGNHNRLADYVLNLFFNGVKATEV
ncbi:MAG TPA: hypothetical protein VGD99_23105 [Anaerolineae bacterium]